MEIFSGSLNERQRQGILTALSALFPSVSRSPIGKRLIAARQPKLCGTLLKERCHLTFWQAEGRFSLDKQCAGDWTVATPQQTQ